MFATYVNVLCRSHAVVVLLSEVYTYNLIRRFIGVTTARDKGTKNKTAMDEDTKEMITC